MFVRKTFPYGYEIFFYNNFVIRALIIYFCFLLRGLINDYKNIYFRNNNVCVEVCELVFMKVDTFKRLFLI